MGTRLAARYELGREIGAGGMGRVYEVVDLETGRQLAAKVMIAGSELDLQALLRFQQEGAVLSTLKHPNIVAVYGTFLEDDACSIIMERLPGRSLRDLMQDGPLALPRVKVLVEQVLSALAYAHGRGIVHRDIKPDNIMVADDDHVKVTDFGIARILAPGSTLNTRTGTTIGTPLYMSPEQIEGQRVDGRSDLYSLGTVMYHLVTGRPPFEGDDPLTVAFQHVHKAPPPPSELNGDVPDDWEEAILRALAKNPADRFQTADAMRDAVSCLTTARPAPRQARTRKPDTIDRIISPEISDEIAVPTQQTAPPRPQSGRTLSVPLPRFRWPYVSAGIGVLAVLLFAVFGFPGRKTAQPTPGTLITSWGGQGSGPGQLTAPSDVRIGGKDTIYVADYDNNRISTFTSAGVSLQQWPLQDPRSGQALSASGLAVRQHGLVYFVDSNGNRVLTLSPRGLVREWRSHVRLLHPSSVALSPSGNVYVVDQGHNRVVELGPRGRLVAHFGGSGSGPAQFNYPTSIAVAPNGNLYVADQGNYRIQELGPHGQPLTSWGTAGTGNSQFKSLAGIAVDGHGNVYTTDSTLGRVQVFTGNGKLQASWGTKGSKRGEMKAPVAVAVDGNGNVYVCDSGNNTILKFAPAV